MADQNEALAKELSKHIVLTGLPATVTPEKQATFKKVFSKKVCEKLGIEQSMMIVHLQTDETKLAIGAFLEFGRAEDADKALAVLNGFKFSKADTFQVSPWSAFVDLKELDEEYQEPEYEEQAGELDLTNPFLKDPQARPQFIVKSGTGYDVEWYWMNTEKGRPDLIRKPNKDRDDNIGQWTEIDRRSKKLQKGMPKPFPMWSPQGNFMISNHRSGLKIWGGTTMAEISRVQETDISAVQVSPSEKYIVVLTRELTVYDVATSKMLRSLKGLDVDLSSWPVAKFNADDTVLAVQTAGNRLNMYESSTMKLLAGTTERVNYTVEIPELRNFEWSPVNPLHIAYVTEGTRDAGWKVSIDNVYVDEGMVTLESIGRRNFFNTAMVNFLWHPSGAYTAAKITKSNSTTEYCIFRVGAKAASAEQLEIKQGQAVRFAWQPDAGNFVISTAASGSKKAAIHFYTAQKLGFKVIQSVESDADGFFWAPKGGRMAAVSFAKSSIELFGLSNDHTKITQINKMEHAFVTNCEWDPTGRYLTTFTSSLKHELDNRWIIFDVNGIIKHDVKCERLSHVSFRPLPPSLLSDEELAKIKRELPEKSKQYTADAEAELRKKEEVENKRKHDLEAKYITRMEAIHKHCQQKGYDNKRAELNKSSPSYKRQLDELAKYAGQTIEEKITTEEIESESPM